jgi:hypothetical protein
MREVRAWQTQRQCCMHELGEPERFSPVGTAARAFHFPTDRSWEDVPKPSTRCLSAFEAIGVDASKSDWMARCEEGRDPDPILQAIEDHRKAYADCDISISGCEELERELPKRLRQSNIDCYETKIIETDDPRWIALQREIMRLMNAETATAMELVNVQPTTLAGAAALLRYVADLEANGQEWPTGLFEDNDKDQHGIGRDWSMFLHRNIASLLTTLM